MDLQLPEVSASFIIYSILLLFDIIFLYFLSRWITKSITSLVHSSIPSINITVHFLSLLLFPGTLLHEVAHLLVAQLLGVRTYTMELYPKLHKQTVRLGSVSMAKTDFFRRALIGLAPFFVGITMLTLILFARQEFHLGSLPQTILIGFLIFEVSNTMFPSKKDMEGIWKFFIVTVSFLIIVLYFGLGGIVRALEETHYLQVGSQYLSIILIVDLAILIFLRLLLYLQAKFSK